MKTYDENGNVAPEMALDEELRDIHDEHLTANALGRVKLLRDSLALAAAAGARYARACLQAAFAAKLKNHDLRLGEGLAREHPNPRIGSTLESFMAEQEPIAVKLSAPTRQYKTHLQRPTVAGSVVASSWTLCGRRVHAVYISIGGVPTCKRCLRLLGRRSRRSAAQEREAYELSMAKFNAKK